MRTAEMEAAQGEAAAAGRRQQVAGGRAGRRASRAPASLEARVTAAQERLAKAQARFHRMQRMLSNRLVAIYKSDTPDLATVLLESDGFSDLLTRTAYIQEINEADMALVDRVQELRNAVRARARPGAGRRVRLPPRTWSASPPPATRSHAFVRPRPSGPPRYARARAAQQAALSSLRSRMAGWQSQLDALQRATGGTGRRAWSSGSTASRSRRRS